jgi:hypothetical protein
MFAFLKYCPTSRRAIAESPDSPAVTPSGGASSIDARPGPTTANGDYLAGDGAHAPSFRAYSGRTAGITCTPP